MDYLHRGYFQSFAICLGLCLSLIGNALELEYIPVEKRRELELEFEQARAPKESLKRKKWNCDMYGMRSHLQVKRDVGLYRWTDTWHNEGAHPVRDYKPGSQALVGRSENLADEVKVNQKGQIIARLSTAAPDQRVLAYSLCSPTP